jgi:hypothetical protein
MTHLSPDGGAMPPPPATPGRQVALPPSSARPALPHPFSGEALLTLIAFRRERLAQLEAEMSAA